MRTYGKLITPCAVVHVPYQYMLYRTVRTIPYRTIRTVLTYSTSSRYVQYVHTDLVRDQCVLPVCVRTVHQIFTKSGRGAYKAAYVRNII